MSTLDPETLQTLALTLFDIDAVRFGRFRLHSGRISPIYLDLRLLVSQPAALRLVARAYAAILDELSFDLLAAIPYAGLPIGVAVSLEMERPLIYPRKMVKEYGTGKQIEGVWQVGQKVAVIEDLITSGDSLLQGAAIMRAKGLVVEEAVVLIDRQQGGVANLTASGLRVQPVMSINHVLSILEDHNRITGKQRQDVLKSLR